MNVTLISANYDAGKYRKGENLGIKALEAILIAYGHKVYIYDMNFMTLSDAQLVSKIVKNESSIVGFSVSFTHQIYETIRLAKEMRKVLKNIHFTIGGQGISFIIPQILDDNKEFDSGMCFEGEMTFLELIQHIEDKKELVNVKGLYYQTRKGVVFGGNRNPIEELDQLPFMFRNLKPNSSVPTHISMITSRGCTGKCLFCSSGYFSNQYHNLKSWRFRSANNIIKEIESLRHYSEQLTISFVDDNFLGGNKEGYDRAKCFSEQIIKKKIPVNWAMECRVDDVNYELFELMCKAGLKNVFLGVESGNEDDLKLFNKRITLQQIDKAIKVLEDIQLTYNIGFIMFHPTSKMKQLILNAEFLKKYNSANTSNLLNELTLYHGSPLVKYYQKKGLLTFEKYSIVSKYEDNKVQKVLNNAKKVLEQLSYVEVYLDQILFQMQSEGVSKIKLRVRYLELKKELSDFEADLFIELCGKIEDENHNFSAELSKKVNLFKDVMLTKIMKLEEG